MRPLGAWLRRLAMTGACLALAGCGGGGDVPDPDSDSKAASADSPAPRGRGARPEPVAVASNDPPAGPEKPAEKAPEPEKPAEKAPEPEKPKGDSSATDEMLGMGGKPQSGGETPSTPPGSGSPTPPGSGSPPQAAPSTPPGSGSPPPATPSTPPGSGSPPAAPSTPPGSGGGSPNVPSQPPNMTPSVPADPPGDMRRNRRPDMGGQPNSAPGGSAGGFGGLGASATPGSPGSRGQDAALSGAAAFQYPHTAVQAFLAALKAKDKDRLRDTTAKRAPTEAAEKHQKLFAAIVEQTLSDEELDELAKALDGFQVATTLPPKSSRRIGVVVTKRSGQDMLQRTIVARQEQEGWKVLDIERLYEFKTPGMIRPNNTKNRK